MDFDMQHDLSASIGHLFQRDAYNMTYLFFSIPPHILLLIFLPFLIFGTFSPTKYVARYFLPLLYGTIFAFATIYNIFNALKYPETAPLFIYHTLEIMYGLFTFLPIVVLLYAIMVNFNFIVAKIPIIKSVQTKIFNIKTKIFLLIATMYVMLHFFIFYLVPQNITYCGILISILLAIVSGFLCWLSTKNKTSNTLPKLQKKDFMPLAIFAAIFIIMSIMPLAAKIFVCPLAADSYECSQI
jgi:hypothetical protein